MDAAPDEIIEMERKYEVGGNFIVPDLSGVSNITQVTAPRRYRLTAIYFDTAGLALARAHITLRRRTGGTDAGWHLKLPAGGGVESGADGTASGRGASGRGASGRGNSGRGNSGRGNSGGGNSGVSGTQSRREIHAPLGSGRGVPPSLLTLVSSCIAGQPVRPVGRLQTGRTVRRLVGPSGRVLAEVADDKVVGSVPGPGTPDATGTAWNSTVSWREVEVELVAGTEDLLDEVGERLLAAGAKPAVAASKLSVVLAAAGELPGAPGTTRQA